jgi:hypothetical protein
MHRCGYFTYLWREVVNTTSYFIPLQEFMQMNFHMNKFIVADYQIIDL